MPKTFPLKSEPSNCPSRTLSPGLLFRRIVYSVDWARKHLDVIVRFGRFPHRNAALGRESTPDELQYLEYLKLAGQWL
jgi:uncharacterized protein (DUF924 family)